MNNKLRLGGETSSGEGELLKIDGGWGTRQGWGGTLENPSHLDTKYTYFSLIFTKPY